MAAQTDNARLARLCREALGSLHCELARREKLVLEQIVTYSFELDLEVAWFGSSDQLALEAGLHKSDASSALTHLRKMRIIQEERAAPVKHFRRPMLYRLLPDALLHVARKPAGSRATEAARAATAKYLIHANRCYPLQPELLPPDPREFDLAMAEISRMSALAHDPVQNEEPKPGVVQPGEAYSSEDEGRPGQAFVFAETELSRVPVSPKEARHELQKALEKTGVAGDAPVRNSQTGSDPSLKISNYGPRAYQISGYSDGELNSPSGNPEGDARGPVGENQTSPPLLARILVLLTEAGEPWKPPAAAQAVMDELIRCMGSAMGNYSGWWWPRCVDPETRGDVVEAIATWKLARHSPRHKPWRGGSWRDEFCRRKRARIASSSTVEKPARVSP